LSAKHLDASENKNMHELCPVTAKHPDDMDDAVKASSLLNRLVEYTHQKVVDDFLCRNSENFV